MNIKLLTKNNMKKHFFLLIAFIVIALTSRAQIVLQQFQIDKNRTQNDALIVPTTSTATSFKFVAILARNPVSTGGYVSGNCKISLVYTETASGDAAIKNDPSTITLGTKDVTSSDYDKTLASLFDIDATLPAHKTSGRILLLVEYLDYSNQSKTIYSNTRYGIYVVPPTKSNIYLVSHKGSTSDFNDIFQLVTTVPSGWQNSGISFKAFTSSNALDMNGVVAIYQHKFKVFDQSTGLLGDPREIFYYSTSQTLTVTPFLGYTYQLESSSIAFYAFSTQVAGTIPVYQCSHKNAPIQLYLSSNADIADSYNTQTAFYAFPI